MFDSCSSLTSVPELPATELTWGCYEYMFQYCSSLAMIKVRFTNWYPSESTYAWLRSVATSGTFECPQKLIDGTTDRTESTVPANWSMVAA